MNDTRTIPVRRMLAPDLIKPGYHVDTRWGEGVVTAIERDSALPWSFWIEREDGKRYLIGGTASVRVTAVPADDVFAPPRDMRLTLRQAAERSGISENALRVAIHRERLTAELLVTPYGERRLVVWPDDLDHYLASRPGGVERRPYGNRA